MTSSGPRAAGTVRPIRYVGDPVLHRSCPPVTAFDDALVALVDDMFASMRAAKGVGLAANQIGVAARVFVYDCPDAAGRRQVGHMVNPTLEPVPAGERRLDDAEEGCLSVPDQWAPVSRPDRAVVRGFDRTGAPVAVEGTGLLARCLQHEVDHLDGHLYLDRLSARERKRVLRAFRNEQGLPNDGEPDLGGTDTDGRDGSDDRAVPAGPGAAPPLPA